MKLSPAFLAYKLSSAFSVLAPETCRSPAHWNCLFFIRQAPQPLRTGSFSAQKNRSALFPPSLKKAAPFFFSVPKNCRRNFRLRFRSPLKAAYPLFFRSCRSFSGTYDSWQKELMQARLDGKSIQHLLNLSLPVFATR